MIIDERFGQTVWVCWCDIAASLPVLCVRYGRDRDRSFEENRFANASVKFFLLVSFLFPSSTLLLLCFAPLCDFFSVVLNTTPSRFVKDIGYVVRSLQKLLVGCGRIAQLPFAPLMICHECNGEVN